MGESTHWYQPLLSGTIPSFLANELLNLASTYFCIELMPDVSSTAALWSNRSTHKSSGYYQASQCSTLYPKMPVLNNQHFQTLIFFKKESILQWPENAQNYLSSPVWYFPLDRVLTNNKYFNLQLPEIYRWFTPAQQLGSLNRAL